MVNFANHDNFVIKRSRDLPMLSIKLERPVHGVCIGKVLKQEEQRQPMAGLAIFSNSIFRKLSHF